MLLEMLSWYTFLEIREASQSMSVCFNEGRELIINLKKSVELSIDFVDYDAEVLVTIFEFVFVNIDN